MVSILLIAAIIIVVAIVLWKLLRKKSEREKHETEEISATKGIVRAEEMERKAEVAEEKLVIDLRHRFDKLAKYRGWPDRNYNRFLERMRDQIEELSIGNIAREEKTLTKIINHWKKFHKNAPTQNFPTPVLENMGRILGDLEKYKKLIKQEVKAEIEKRKHTRELVQEEARD